MVSSLTINMRRGKTAKARMITEAIILCSSFVNASIKDNESKMFQTTSDSERNSS